MTAGTRVLRANYMAEDGRGTDARVSAFITYTAHHTAGVRRTGCEDRRGNGHSAATAGDFGPLYQPTQGGTVQSWRTAHGAVGPQFCHPVQDPGQQVQGPCPVTGPRAGPGGMSWVRKQTSAQEKGPNHCAPFTWSPAGSEAHT